MALSKGQALLTCPALENAFRGVEHARETAAGEVIVDGGTLLRAVNEPRLPKHRKMLADRGGVRADNLGKLADAMRGVLEAFEDEKPRGVAERLEDLRTGLEPLPRWNCGLAHGTNLAKSPRNGKPVSAVPVGPAGRSGRPAAGARRSGVNAWVSAVGRARVDNGGIFGYIAK